MSEAEIFRIVFTTPGFDGLLTVNTLGYSSRLSIYYDDEVYSTVLDLIDTLQLAEVLATWVRQKRQELCDIAHRAASGKP